LVVRGIRKDLLADGSIQQAAYVWVLARSQIQAAGSSTVEKKRSTSWTGCFPTYLAVLLKM
jgi:hypothetical protein